MPARTVARALTVATAVGILSALLGGCAVAPAPEAKLPDTVTVTLQQTREDIGQRKLEIRVFNGSDDLLTVTGMTFSAPQFEQTMKWEKPSTAIMAGVAADLTVALTEPACREGAASGTVALAFELEDGQRGTANIEPRDEFGRLPIIRTSDCFAEAVEDRVDIALASELRILDVGGRLTAQLDVTLTPTTGTGSLTIDAATSTVLLTLADADPGDTTESGIAGLKIDATTPPTVVTLTFVPSRCDAHVIAEDKRGTYLPLKITLDDRGAGTYYVTSTPELKAQFYAFVADACGLP